MQLFDPKNLAFLLIAVLVTGITALNSYTTHSASQLFVAGYDYNAKEFVRNQIVADTQATLAEMNKMLDDAIACGKITGEIAQKNEAKFQEAAGYYVRARAEIQALSIEIYGLQSVISANGQHIRECHRLLKENNIPIPGGEPQPEEPEPAQAKPTEKTADLGSSLGGSS